MADFCQIKWRKKPVNPLETKKDNKKQLTHILTKLVPEQVILKLGVFMKAQGIRYATIAPRYTAETPAKYLNHQKTQYMIVVCQM